MKKKVTKSKKYPTGHILTYWIAIGLPIGVAIGAALGNIGIGPAIGVAIGAVMGMCMEKKAENEGLVRPMTNREKKKQEKFVWWGIILGLIVLAIAATSYFLGR